MIGVVGEAEVRPPGRDGRESVSQARPPSWLAVIATTLRLFVQRRVLRAADRPGGRNCRRDALLALLLAVVLAAAAATAITVVTRQPTATQSPRGRQHPAVAASTGDPALPIAAQNRMLAAAWITAQVSQSVVVACDPLMCESLVQDGFPAGDLQEIGTGAADPLGASVVVATATVRSEFGSRLTNVYAPAVLARFGSGPDLVAVLATAPDGAAAYLPAANADLLARQQAGALLLHNANVHATASAQAELADGRVDSRLLLTIAALAHAVPVYIRQFGDAGPGAGADAPLRSMTISGTVPLAAGRSYPATVLAFLQAQRPPLPTGASVARSGGGTVLRINVTAPSPLGLLPAPAPNSP